jgi:hypothetical protein
MIEHCHGGESQGHNDGVDADAVAADGCTLLLGFFFLLDAVTFVISFDDSFQRRRVGVGTSRVPVPTVRSFNYSYYGI